ncbi:MAG: hypothetical protein ACR2MA_02960 [Egibacteraceae bacterium]
MSTDSTADATGANEPLTKAFDSFDEAERVRSRLEDAGLPQERVRLHHGAGDQDFGPGTSGPRDDEIAARMLGRGGIGVILGTILGGCLAAAIAAAFTQPFTPAWWGATLGGGFAGFGVGLLWGFMGGSTGRSPRRYSSGDSGPSTDASEEITLTVDPANANERDLTQRILDEAGGHAPSPRFPG